MACKAFHAFADRQNFLHRLSQHAKRTGTIFGPILGIAPQFVSSSGQAIVGYNLRISEDPAKVWIYALNLSSTPIVME